MTGGSEPLADAVPHGSVVAIKNARSGAMYLWFGQVVPAVIFVSQGVLGILQASLAEHLIAAALCVPLVALGRITGLFVTRGVLRLRFGGFTRWEVPIADVTSVNVAGARLPGVWGRAKSQPYRVEIQCSSDVRRIPRDVISYLFSTDPTESARATAHALAKELRSAGAVRLGA